MEVLTEIGKQSPILLTFSGVIWWLLADRKALKDENKALQDLVLLQQREQTDREKEIADDKSEELKATIPTLNKIASVLDEHNKLTEYEQRKR